MLVKGHCQQTAVKINSSVRLKSNSKTEQGKQYVTLGNEECLVEQHHGTSPRLLLARKALSRNTCRDTKHKIRAWMSLTWKTACAKTIIPLSYKQHATDLKS